MVLIKWAVIVACPSSGFLSTEFSYIQLERKGFGFL